VMSLYLFSPSLSAESNPWSESGTDSLFTVPAKRCQSLAFASLLT